MAQKVYTLCVDSGDGMANLVPIEALAEVLEELSLRRQPDREDPGYLLEARMELEWRSTMGLGGRTAAGELRLFAADLRPRELPKDTLLARLNAREADLGFGHGFPNLRAMVGPKRQGAGTLRRPFGEDLLPAEAEPSVLEKSEDGSVLFLKVGLCASRDVYPDGGEVTHRGMLATPRLNAPEASRVLPHIVFVSPALLHARLPTTGECCAFMPPPDNGACAVPVCTCARLCDTQRAAFMVPREPSRHRPPEPSPRTPAKPVPATPLSR
ncbi:ANK1 [Symbiodinium natans]|uniref:ANK1 protein n=1 Tax=Symbiodinium natans TaxID=878477 RepID=A0A812UF91_9DINO|nr:ANK1 [Symbiodinium natans]